MGEHLKPDLCVIGAGAGGLSVAAVAASFGVPVVLVERSRMGGECLNTGCVPSKALIAAANRMQAVREAARFGIGRGRSEPAVHFEKVHDHVQAAIAAVAPNDSAERFTALGVRVIRSSARFTGPRTVAAGDATVEARRFVLATGSRPAVPAIPGLEGVPYLTNETIFGLTARPAHLLVIGGGPVGVELAQAHRRLGAAVTLFEAGRILAAEDPEMASVVERALLADGVTLNQGVAIERVESRADGAVAVAVRRGDDVAIVEGSHLLVAAGREPDTEGLGLEEAGIAFGPAGIAVDSRLRTTNRRVYAVGDCAGGAVEGGRFTHAAGHQAGVVIRNALFRWPAKVGDQPIPRVAYTAPELASVGLTAAEAEAKRGAIRILRWPVAENDRAQAERATLGHLKAVVTRRGTILGCSIAGPHAGELIVPWVLALTKGLKVQDLADLVVPYPTFSEVTKRAAVEFLRPSAENPWLRRFIGVARRLG